MESIKDTIQNVMSELKAKKSHPDKLGPEEVLKKALTKKELEHIKFNYFKKGVLGVNVDSSTWLYQFNLKKEDLLGRLKEHLSGIKDIRLRLGG